MSASSGMNKLAAERNQRILLELVSQPGNNVCADCKARNPRWASFNLGIFICVGCASIHRKIGTHVSKVKSLTLDSWNKDQVDRMKELGNVKSNAIYNPNEHRHPPPTVLDDPTRDNDLEQYIRSKYEYRRFMDKHALVASKLGPSRSASSVVLRPSPSPPSQSPPKPPPPASTATAYAANMFSTTKPQIQRRATPPQATQVTPNSSSVSQPAVPQNNQQVAPQPVKPEGVWADLISLQEPSSNASLPLQYQAPVHTYSGAPFSSSAPAGAGTNPFSNMTGLPTGNPSFNPFSQQAFATNPLTQQQSFSAQPTMSSFQSPMSIPSFQPATPQVPSSFNQQPTTLFQNQVQSQSPSIPFYQPQPQSSSSFSPAQSQPQFLSSSPNTHLFSQSPHLQTTTTPNQLQSNPGFNGSMTMGGGVGQMTPSPQPVMNTAMSGQNQVQGNTTMGMHLNGGGAFGTGYMQPQQHMSMGNPFGQPQFTQGGFTGQSGTQWGVL